MNVQRRLAPGKYRLQVEDYLSLDQSGVFDGTRTELLDGDVIIMNAEYRPHARIASELSFRLRLALQALGTDLAVLTGSVAASSTDMPLPDIVLTSAPHGDGPIPLPSVALVVEVSSTALARDLRDKAMIYARAGIPEYWVADVNGRVIYQMWASAGDSYTERREVAFSKPVASATLSGLAIATSAL